MTERYYVVLDFMVSELQLKGLERDIYAIIYGFCQAGKSYTGSLKYLADWTLTTKQGVLKVLKKLEEKGLIVRKEKYINDVKFVEYFAVRPAVDGVKQSLTEYPTEYPTEFNGGKQSLTGYSTEFNGGGKQSLPNNKENNKNINNINKKEKLKKEKSSSSFPETEECKLDILEPEDKYPPLPPLSEYPF